MPTNSLFDSIMKLSQLFYNILGIIGFVSIIGVFISYIITKKQLNITTMSRCIDNYRKQFMDLKASDDVKIIRQYIDFVNEELFYFQDKFIPYEVAFEWVSGMIDFMPIIYEGENKNCNVVSQKITKNNLLEDYPRAITAFTIRKRYNYDLIHSNQHQEREKRNLERKSLITEILVNIGLKKHWYNHEQ